MSGEKKAKVGKAKKAKREEIFENVYVVERLVDKREYDHWKLGTIVQYLVKWEGYSDNESTWEPEWNISEVMKHAYNHGLLDYLTEVAGNTETARTKTKPTLAAGSILHKCTYPMCRSIECVPCDFFVCSGCLPEKPTNDDEDTFAAVPGSSKWVSNFDFVKKASAQIVPYCSRSCQQKDWSRHKSECNVKKSDCKT